MSTYLSIYLSIFPPTHLSVSHTAEKGYTPNLLTEQLLGDMRDICLPIYLPTYLSTYPPIYLSYSFSAV